MADNFIGINRGALDDVPASITVGSSTGAKDIELRVDTGKGTTRQDVIKALEAIRSYILSNGYQSAANLPPL
jgi:hypothetical protein